MCFCRRRRVRRNQLPAQTASIESIYWCEPDANPSFSKRNTSNQSRCSDRNKAFRPSNSYLPCKVGAAAVSEPGSTEVSRIGRAKPLSLQVANLRSNSGSNGLGNPGGAVKSSGEIVR
jgi:hypothetical protein